MFGAIHAYNIWLTIINQWLGRAGCGRVEFIIGVRGWVRIEEWAVKTQTTSKLACKSVRKSLTGMSETQEGLYLT